MKFINSVSIIIVGIVLYKYLYNTKSPKIDYTAELIKKRGYPVEVHNEVITEDGYILTIHRIPHGIKSGKNEKKRYPVLLVPGVFGTSANFVWMDADNGLGFLLADLGYDVWIGNIRSASYCQRHIKYDAEKDPEFWNYTTTEVASYDLAAKIDYILEKTGFESLQYVGHSQGTLLLSILLAERPEYNKKLDLFVCLAPGFYLNATKDPVLSTFFNNQETIKKVTDLFGIQVYNYFPAFLSNILHMFWKMEYCKPYFRNLFVYLSGDGDTNFEVVMDILPSLSEVTGLKQFYHNGQLHNTGTFQKYDFGKEGNLIQYGVENPPPYNIKNIKVKTALFYSSTDIFIATENVERMANELPNVVEKYLISDKPFSHVDFIMGKTAVDVVYKRTFEVMEKYKRVK